MPHDRAQILFIRHPAQRDRINHRWMQVCQQLQAEDGAELRRALGPSAGLRLLENEVDQMYLEYLAYLLVTFGEISR